MGCVKTYEENLGLIGWGTWHDSASCRVNASRWGGGSLYDIGTYCINAARYLFQENPIEICAFSVEGTERRFREGEELG